MSKTLKIFFGFLVALTVAGAVALPAVAANHKFPLCHGKNSTQCRPDPQPSKGKDCQKHGKGGVNEDHCKVSPSPDPTPSQSVSPSPSPSTSTTPPGVPGGKGSRGTSSGRSVGSLARTGGIPWWGILIIAVVGGHFLLWGLFLVIFARIVSKAKELGLKPGDRVTFRK